ncbi:MAG: DnaD domain protein [Eubacteriales bacterium]|nr:DnaD domain protein [Eubacteriales bacterium]
MDYRILPFGNVWDGGIFNVPSLLVDKYLKMASEYQLKALLFILRNNGQSDSAELAKALGQTTGDIDNILEFWVEEGILSVNGTAVEPQIQVTEPEPEKEKKPKAKDTMSPPTLSPKDIIAILRDDEKLRFLLTEAQTVLGRGISRAEQEMLINMVNYYGLKPEIVLMILEFYRAEKLKGRSIGISYVNSMAKNWAEEGIDNLADAEEKLKEIERSDRLWNEVTALTGIRHRRPTVKQREMITQWFDDFDISMVSLACDIMKENIPEPKLSYVNSVLKKWKKEGITSPSQVKAQQEEFEKQKNSRKDGDKLKSKPTYDLEKIKQDAMNNTDL